MYKHWLVYACVLYVIILWLAIKIWGGLFNAIADLYICDGFARLLRLRKVKLAMWLRELLKAIVCILLIEYCKQLANPHR